MKRIKIGQSFDWCLARVAFDINAEFDISDTEWEKIKNDPYAIREYVLENETSREIVDYDLEEGLGSPLFIYDLSVKDI